MFVKIVYWKVEKEKAENELRGHKITNRILEVEHGYDVNHYSLFPTKEPEANEMNLCLEFNKDGPDGWDRTISFPKNRSEEDNQVIEIYIMNNHGKTIQKYIY